MNERAFLECTSNETVQINLRRYLRLWYREGGRYVAVSGQMLFMFGELLRNQHAVIHPLSSCDQQTLHSSAVGIYTVRVSPL